MTVEEFLIKFANIPIDKRMVVIDFGQSGSMTLAEIYNQVRNLEDYMRPIRTQQQNLIDLASKFL